MQEETEKFRHSRYLPSTIGGRYPRSPPSRMKCRNTTSSEKPRIPKRLKQLYLFRKVWFKETIIDSVLQMNVLAFH